MPQDAFTLRYLCAELDGVFRGGKINRIVQPSNDELILTVYTGKRTEKLLLNVNPASPRIGVVTEDVQGPLTAPNFCMLMRKHLLSATITQISLVGFDRIVKINFMASAEFFDAVEKTVYVELMGRYSNVILTENGKVLGGNRGINMFDDGVRPLIVGHPYVFPPVANKKIPEDKSLINVFNGVAKTDLAKTICDNVQGVALSTANEIVLGYSNVENSQIIENGSVFCEYLQEFLYNKKACPCVVIDNQVIKDVCVYPYKTLAGDVKKFSTLIEAEDYYFTNKERIKKFTAKKERLNSLTATAIKKVKKRLTAIKAKEKDAVSAEDNKIKGELLLANIYRLKNGIDKCVLENYYDGAQMEILLDERLSISKNAENYYKKYNKQKRTMVALKPQREQAEAELDYLNSVLDEISLCETFDDLIMVQGELENAAIIVDKNTNKRKKENQTFCRVYDVFGYRVKAGRNNLENDKLTFTAKSTDLWLHAKDYHSTHVVIECNGSETPQKVVLAAAEICAYFSKGREGGKTEIVYTQRKNVKKPPKAKAGFVTYENYKSITVNPKKHTEFLKCE